MSTGVFFILSLAAGAVLGVFYLGGLWLTLRRLPGAKNPGLLMLFSFFGRTAVVTAGLYLMAEGGLDRLAAGVAGFLIVRAVMVRRMGPAKSRTAQQWK